MNVSLDGEELVQILIGAVHKMSSSFQFSFRDIFVVVALTPTSIFPKSVEVPRG